MENSATLAAIPILITSLIGSPHCAGMCGGFVAIYSHGTERHRSAHLLYSLGRLTTYLALGIVAAFLGQTVDSFISISRASAVIVGVSLVTIGILNLFGTTGLFSSKLLLKMAQPVKALAGPIFSSQSRLKPFLIGLVTTLLPCGWLYTFVALAAASADPLQALIIMGLFWLGTLPVMLSLGFISRALTQKLGSYLPRLTGVLLVVSGLLSLTIHFQHADHSHHSHHTHQDSH